MKNMYIGKIINGPFMNRVYVGDSKIIYLAQYIQPYNLQFYDGSSYIMNYIDNPARIEEAIYYWYYHPIMSFWCTGTVPTEPYLSILLFDQIKQTDLLDNFIIENIPSNYIRFLKEK